MPRLQCPVCGDDLRWPTPSGRRGAERILWRDEAKAVLTAARAARQTGGENAK